MATPVFTQSPGKAFDQSAAKARNAPRPKQVKAFVGTGPGPRGAYVIAYPVAGAMNPFNTASRTSIAVSSGAITAEQMAIINSVFEFDATGPLQVPEAFARGWAPNGGSDYRETTRYNSFSYTCAGSSTRIETNGTTTRDCTWDGSESREYDPDTGAETDWLIDVNDTSFDSGGGPDLVTTYNYHRSLASDGADSLSETGDYSGSVGKPTLGDINTYLAAIADGTVSGTASVDYSCSATAATLTLAWDLTWSSEEGTGSDSGTITHTVGLSNAKTFDDALGEGNSWLGTLAGMDLGTLPTAPILWEDGTTSAFDWGECVHLYYTFSPGVPKHFVKEKALLPAGWLSHPSLERRWFYEVNTGTVRQTSVSVQRIRLDDAGMSVPWRANCAAQYEHYSPPGIPDGFTDDPQRNGTTACKPNAFRGDYVLTWENTGLFTWGDATIYWAYGYLHLPDPWGSPCGWAP